MICVLALKTQAIRFDFFQLVAPFVRSNQPTIRGILFGVALKCICLRSPHCRTTLGEAFTHFLLQLTCSRFVSFFFSSHSNQTKDA